MMHGLFNRSIERFVRDTYGCDVWVTVARRMSLDLVEFEPMLIYDDEITAGLLGELSGALGKTPDELLEDIGTYLVSHPNSEVVRRLLRFSGTCFVDFLHSLDDLPARARLAMPDLVLPDLELRQIKSEYFCLTVHSGNLPISGFGHVVMGLLRAMADDYGALVFLEHEDGGGGRELVKVRLLDSAFASGREFDLGARTG